VGCFVRGGLVGRGLRGSSGAVSGRLIRSRFVGRDFVGSRLVRSGFVSCDFSAGVITGA
jgi:hypothetical protein